MIEAARTSCEKHVRATSEKHAEYVIRVKLVFTELIRISLLEILFCTMLIIDPSLIWVTQTGEGCTDLLEGFTGVWCPVFVRMELECKLFVSFLDLILLG